MTQKVKVTSGTLLSTRSRQSFIACLLRGPSYIVLQSERRNRQMRDKREMPTGTLSQDVVPTYLTLRGRQDEIAKMNFRRQPGVILRSAYNVALRFVDLFGI
jgi:hypothetical protein